MLSHPQEQKRVDPRIRRTRRLLSQAFMELINEKGFQSLTVQDITDRAEVNRATFYAHFEDKFDLLDSFVREGFLEWLSQHDHALGGSGTQALGQHDAGLGSFGTEALGRLVEAIFEFTERMDMHCGRLDKQLEPMLAIAVQEELTKYSLTWFRRIPSEAMPLSQPPETVAMLWSWAILGASMQWSRTTRTPSAGEMAAQVAQVLMTPLG